MLLTFKAASIKMSLMRMTSRIKPAPNRQRCGPAGLVILHPQTGGFLYPNYPRWLSYPHRHRGPATNWN